jgi:hypothetical protein
MGQGFKTETSRLKTGGLAHEHKWRNADLVAGTLFQEKEKRAEILGTVTVALEVI